MPSQSTATDERPKYAHWFRCRTCGNRFSVVRLTDDSSRVKVPKCPRRSCGGKARESHVPDIGFDAADGRAPATTSIQATAYDTALRMVTEDQGVTNILDRPRVGESSAPPLEPRLQKLSDGFWGGQRQQSKTRTARADLSGIYGERAIAAQAGAPAIGTRFSADRGVGIQPILTSKPPGTSPIPAHKVIGDWNPNRK